MPERLLPYEDALRAYCAHRVRRRDLDDVVQDVWLKALASTVVYRSEGELRAWLYRVARSVIVDRSRRHSWPLAIDPDQDQAGESSDPADELLVRERNRALARAILRLTPKQARVIACRWVAGLSERATAAHMELPVGACKQLQNRGLESLRRERVA
jgi:RNA polymerase sigma-70 factor, ECF subfamily